MVRDVNTYATMNVGMSKTYLCAKNKINRMAFEHTQRNCQLVDFIGNLSESIRVVSLRNFQHTNGCVPRHDLKMAYVTQLELARMGLLVESDFYKKHTKTLIATNMLTGLCYKSYKPKKDAERKSCLVTKNNVIINFICNTYGVNYPTSQIDKHKIRLCINEEEVQTGKMLAVKPILKNGQMRLAAENININSKSTVLLPWFEISNYRYCVANCLLNGIFEIVTPNYKIATSLNSSIIAKNTNLNPQSVINHAISSSDSGIMYVVDFITQGIVKFNVLDITSCKKV